MRVLDLLTERLFDYAGLYPPASKPLAEALRESAAFPKTLHRPALVAADLVAGPAEISGLTDRSLQASGFEPGQGMLIALLGAALSGGSELISEERLSELNMIQGFNRGGLQATVPHRIISYELKLDRALVSDRHLVKIGLRNIRTYLQEEPLRIFVEIDLSAPTWDEELVNLGTLIAETNRSSSGPVIGIKVRGGGPTPIDNEKLARTIEVVADEKLPLKATAGFHHPIIETARYQNNLGFMNLLVALYLRRHYGANDLVSTQVLACLQNEDPKAFELGEKIRYRDFELSAAEVREMKEAFFFSIGSCSLNEPDEDLSRLFGAPKID